MNKNLLKYPRILAIAPSSRGFGYALLEGHRLLVDWGVRLVEGDKNSGAVRKVQEMMGLYHPQVIILEDTEAKGSRRSPRIKALSKRLVTLAKNRAVKVLLLSQKQVRQSLLGDADGTKDAVAKIIAERFSEELSFRLPPKRRKWTSEDSRMSIFDAVALALTYYQQPR